MAEVVSRIYSNFRGVDFRGLEVNLVRSPDSLNVWKDYKETESIRTRPEMALKESFDTSVYGVFFYKTGNTEMMLVHSGTTLYKVANGVKTILFTGLNKARSDGFVYNNVWYFKDGLHYLQYDGETIKEVEGYVPTTSIGRKPSGGGTLHEDVNLLSDWRINTFVSDGETLEYHLDAQNISWDRVPEVYVNGEKVTYAYNVDYDKGIIKFTNKQYSPPVPLTDGQDNVSIKFMKKVDGYSDRIKKCTLLQVFDNRVFFSGNKDFPNVIFHCSLNDPSYCSDLDYYNEGLDSAEVKGLVAGNNVLWVFKEPSQENTTVFYHNPTIDAEYGKIYPSTHSSIATGCIGKAINFNDDIVFFSDRGMEAINGDVTTEQVIAHRSTLVDRKLLTEADYKNMMLEEWEGYLMVIVGDKVYLADSRGMFENGNHIEYEWFYWHMPKRITCTKVYKGILYLGTEDGIYTLTDYKSDVESYWTTPIDKFENPHYQKTTSKKSCTVEANGEEISVYAKTNKDDDFGLLGTYSTKDAFSCRIKKKKFKDVQLKFSSTKRFSLESATLECFIGGYLKNL